MSKTLFLSGLANFEEDVVQEITFDRYAEYQRSIGKPVDVDPINFPQKIEFEFASNALITNHYITSSEPLKFRYIYDGRFEYDEAGSMKFASIDSVTVAYQDLYPGDEYEYGYFYKTSSPVVIEDVNNFSQWEDAMNSAMDDSAVVHEYEEQDGVIRKLAGSGKEEYSGLTTHICCHQLGTSSFLIVICLTALIHNFIMEHLVMTT